MYETCALRKQSTVRLTVGLSPTIILRRENEELREFTSVYYHPIRTAQNFNPVVPAEDASFIAGFPQMDLFSLVHLSMPKQVTEGVCAFKRMVRSRWLGSTSGAHNGTRAGAPEIESTIAGHIAAQSPPQTGPRGLSMVCQWISIVEEFDTVMRSMPARAA
ncbi:hypothetical protein Tco_0398355 [Tanacetum coccineum]